MVRFQGETAYDAVVNHFGLDLEEEDQFVQWLETAGLSLGSSQRELEKQYHLWHAAVERTGKTAGHKYDDRYMNRQRGPGGRRE